MLNWWLRRRIAAFEQMYGYDMGYARALLAADRGAFLAFSQIMPLSRWRRDVPVIAYYAAKIIATAAEDCGPCTQLMVTMAEREGCGVHDLRAILAGDLQAMSEAARLGTAFAHATLTHNPDAATLRAEISRRWGERAVISLAFAISAARVFPRLKYALGHGIACSRVRVGQTDVPVMVVVVA